MNNKYIKKTVEIEAIQWNGNNLEEIMKFLNSEFSYAKNTNYITKKFSYYQTTNNLYINTLEGEMKANIGDYIIKGIKGEYYPCKPDIFELTYEKVYTPEEVKKMWEALEYEYIEFGEKIIKLVKNIFNVAKITIEICYGKDFRYMKYGESGDSRLFTLEEHNLITKTIKALEKEINNER